MRSWALVCDVYFLEPQVRLYMYRSAVQHMSPLCCQLVLRGTLSRRCAACASCGVVDSAVVPGWSCTVLMEHRDQCRAVPCCDVM